MQARHSYTLLLRLHGGAASRHIINMNESRRQKNERTRTDDMSCMLTWLRRGCIARRSAARGHSAARVRFQPLHQSPASRACRPLSAHVNES
eukprot:46162-Eustigmatos_ZCMA.PRE.1